MRGFAVLITLLTLAVVPVLGQANPDLKYTPPSAPNTVDATNLIVRLVALVGVLLMLCLGVLWYARNSRKVPTPHTTPSSLMELQGTLLLDRRAALHMLRVDGHDVAVTTDASGLKSVVVLTEPFDPTLTSITDPA
jgi:hypothetical protein